MSIPHQSPLSNRPTAPHRRSLWASARRYSWHFFALAAFSTLAGFHAARLHANTPWNSSASVQAASIDALSAPDAGIDAAAINLLSPQDQAERLLAAAIRRDLSSVDLISKNVDLWRGHLRNTDLLFDLTRVALNSGNLDVRASALEIDLAANDLDKSPASIALLVKEIHRDPAQRPWALWRLGALGNRGVQPKIVLAQLLSHLHDRDEDTRYWTVEALSILGTDAVVDPLLDRFAHDPSPRIRQRAACNLAQAGMLTPRQRLAAVPSLLNLFDDDSLDSATRGYVFGALRLITGQPLGNNADSWRKWWAARDARHKSSPRTNILHA